MMRISKRASDDVLWVEVMWLLLVLILVSVFIVFVHKTINGQTINEEIYSKKIAVIMDGARPGSEFILDVSKAVSVGKKGNLDCYAIDKPCFSFNKEYGYVEVKLGNDNLAKRYLFFSSYEFSFELKKTGADDRSILIISCK